MIFFFTLDCLIIMGGFQKTVSIICPLADVSAPLPSIPTIDDFDYPIAAMILAWHGGSVLACGGHDTTVATYTRQMCLKLDWVTQFSFIMRTNICIL